MSEGRALRWTLDRDLVSRRKMVVVAILATTPNGQTDGRTLRRAPFWFCLESLVFYRAKKTAKRIFRETFGVFHEISEPGGGLLGRGVGLGSSAMPRVTTQFYSSENASRATEGETGGRAKLFVYTCRFTGKHALVTDVSLKSLPLRPRDSASVLDMGKHETKVYLTDGGVKRIKREGDGKVERQYRLNLGELPVAYTFEPDGKVRTLCSPPPPPSSSPAMVSGRHDASVPGTNLTPSNH